MGWVWSWRNCRDWGRGGFVIFKVYILVVFYMIFYDEVGMIIRMNINKMR